MGRLGRDPRATIRACLPLPSQKGVGHYSEEGAFESRKSGACHLLFAPLKTSKGRKGDEEGIHVHRWNFPLHYHNREKIGLRPNYFSKC